MDWALDWFSWLLIAVVVILVLERWRGSRGIAPGPTGLPIVGYYPFLEDDLYDQFRKLRKIYGDIFSFRTVGENLVFIVNGSAVKEMLVDRAEEFYGRGTQFNVLNFFDDGLGIAQSEGTDWKEKRKFFLTTIRNFGLGKIELEEYMQELIQKMISDITKLGKEPFNIREKIAFVTGNTIAKMICDKKFKDNDPEFYDMVEAFDHILGGGIQTLFMAGFWFRMWLKFSKIGRTRMKAVKKLHFIIKKIVDEHIRTFDPLHQRDFIDAYLSQMKILEEKNQLQKSSFSMDALKSITLNMLLEGTESTGSTIANFLSKLSHYPDIQKKAQMEIDEVVGQSRLPAWNDRLNMPYVEALILELFRDASFFSFSTFYSNFEEAYVRGYRIPKRSFLTFNFDSINRDPKLFPNPNKFDPERFIGSDGKKIKRENSVGFGVGRRACVGEGLAQIEVFLIITSLLQNFSLYPCEGHFQVRVEPRTKDIST